MAHMALVADFTKKDARQRIVEGIAVSSNVDRDRQIIDEDFLKRTYKQWATRYGNVRFQHQPKVVGKVLTCSDWDDQVKGFYITAKISDDDAWEKIENGEINGFSIGIKNAVVVPDAAAKNGRLIDGEVIETSIVDLPSSYSADFMVVKSAMFDVTKGSWLDSPNDDTPDPDTDIISLDSIPNGVDDDIDVQQDATKTLDTSSGLQPYNLEGDKEDKSTVEDNKETQETVVEKTTEADFAKAADVAAVRESMDGLVTSLTEIRALIEAMASQTDKDKDGDIDFPAVDAQDDAAITQHAIETTGADAPNAVQDTLDNALKAALIDEVTKAVLAELSTQTADVTKTVTAEKAALADVTKSVDAVQSELAKFVERLEVVEQSAAPAKGVTMVVEKFAGADAGEVVDENAKVNEIVKTVTAQNRGLSPVIIQQRVDAAIAEYKGGNK